MMTKTGNTHVEGLKFSLKSALEPFQILIENKIKLHLSPFKSKGRLQEACEYALLNGGKRFRPALVFMIANGLDKKCDPSSAALAIEYFHTASLVADDLPCMDDDDLRRDKPSVHKVFGETIALLASYALIAEGYNLIASCTKEQKNKGFFTDQDADFRGMLALENAAYNTGLSGATGGQYLDIFPPDLNLSTMRKIIHQKTVSLFEISFLFGWLFGKGELQLVPNVKQAASHFGMAFQIADDIDDIEQDVRNRRQVNLASVIGIDAARELFHEELNCYRQQLKVLNLKSKELFGLAEYLEDLVAEKKFKTQRSN